MAQIIAQNAAAITPRPGPAVVVSAGRMQRAVKARQVKEVWNVRLRKSFYKDDNFLVSDPNSSLVEGDVITTTPERHSKWIKHTVASIVAPFGKPIDERPPILSAEQRRDMVDAKRVAKLERRAARGIPSAMQELKARQKASEPSEARPSLVGGFAQLHDEAQAEDRMPGPERPKDAMGRSVLPGGQHAFGGKGHGGINTEAAHGATRARERYQRAQEHEAERDAVEAEPSEEIAKQHLEGRR